MVLTYLLNQAETRKYVSAQIDIEVGANLCTQSTAGVVASCKIPILATRVRFPGSAVFFIQNDSAKRAQVFIFVDILEV